MWKALAVVTCLAGAAWAKPPHGAATIKLDYTYTSFHRNQHHYVIEWKNGGYTVGSRAVDAKLVDALYAALTDLRESDKDLQCISHTDDYPDFSVDVAGDEPVSLHSSSNCHAFVPWNVTKNGKSYAQFTGAAWKAVHALLSAADPDTWKTPDGPEATTMLGGEFVVVDEMRRGTTGKLAAACARAIETDARLQKALGEVVKVKELVLACNLGASADCSKTEAEAELQWESVAARIDVGCTAGKVDTSDAALAKLAEVRKFLESKPVRVLVKLSTEPPRMWDAHGWRVEADVELPSLDYDPASKRIEVRGMSEKGPAGPKFWKELGIDPAKLTKKDHDWYETTATLDLDGKLVKSR